MTLITFEVISTHDSIHENFQALNIKWKSGKLFKYKLENSFLLFKKFIFQRYRSRKFQFKTEIPWTSIQQAIFFSNLHFTFLVLVDSTSTRYLCLL